MTAAPPLLVEYLHPDESPITLAELSLDFLEANGLPIANAGRPFRVEVEPRTSKKGNTYYSYDHGKVPLPDGLDTVLRVGGEVVAMEPSHLSQSGNPTRPGRATISHGGLRYDVTVYVTEGTAPYWVKVHAQKAAGQTRSKTGPAGGRIV